MRYLILAGAAVTLSGCAGLGVGGGGHDFTELVKAMITDPHCGHKDNLQFVAGVLSGSAVRDCPTPQAPALAVGTVVAPLAAPPPT